MLVLVLSLLHHWIWEGLTGNALLVQQPQSFGAPNVTLGNVNAGVVTATSYEGNGAKLTGLPAGFTELDAALFN